MLSFGRSLAGWGAEVEVSWGILVTLYSLAFVRTMVCGRCKKLMFGSQPFSSCVDLIDIGCVSLFQVWFIQEHLE
jgi:hypothetical protein